MRILFCDDNPEILSQLQHNVLEYFVRSGLQTPEMACYRDGQSLLDSENRADIAFLDVEMPGISGILTGKKLKEKNPGIMIFIVTSYADYLDNAMDTQVFRFLTKPVDKDRLFRSLKDALRQYGMSTLIPIKTSDGLFMRTADEIICVRAQQRNVYIHTTSETLCTRENIEHWMTVLNAPCFFLTHRSFIVNMRFVQSICRDEVHLRHREQTIAAYLSQRKYKEFKHKYLVFIESIR